MDYLMSERGVMSQLRWHLCIMCVYNPIKRSHERQWLLSAQRRQQEEEDEQRQHRQQLSKEHGRQQACSALWTLPSLPCAFRTYNIVSAILLAWVFLKYLFPGVIARLGRFYYGQLLHGSWPYDDDLRQDCLVFGRFSFHYEQPVEVFGFQLTAFHLLWKSAQMIVDRAHAVDVALFLMQPRRELERFIEKLEATGWATHDDDDHYHHNQANNNTTKVQMTAYEHFLERLMCFKVSHGEYCCNANGQWRGRVMLRVRANRTLRARDRLVERLCHTTLMEAAIVGLLVVVFTSYISAMLFFNQHSTLR